MNTKTKANLCRLIGLLAPLEAKASGFCQLNYKTLGGSIGFNPKSIGIE